MTGITIMMVFNTKGTPNEKTSLSLLTESLFASARTKSCRQIAIIPVIIRR